MTKSYPEQLAQWVNNRKTSKQAKNLSAFLAVKKDISDALEAGFAAKTIWAHLKESQKISFGYDTFLNLIKRHIPSYKDTSIEKAKVETAAKSTPSTPPKEEASDKQPTPPVQKKSTGFRYNPTPNLEELI